MASKYDEKTKEEVVAFIRQYNQEHGRGGQSAAVKKWKLNAVTVKSWLEKAGVETPGRGGKKKRGARKARVAKGAKAEKAPRAAKKAAGKRGGRRRGRGRGRAAKPAADDFADILNRMVAIRNEMASLQSEYAALKAKL